MRYRNSLKTSFSCRNSTGISGKAVPNSPLGLGDQPNFQTCKTNHHITFIQFCINVYTTYETPTHQRWDSGVAVYKGQPGQADDDVAQDRRKEHWDVLVSVVTQSQHALQTFNQLSHDLTTPPFTLICKTQVIIIQHLWLWLWWISAEDVCSLTI